MKFRTRKQCSAWCDTANKLAIDVEMVTARYQNKLTRACDPRLTALARAIWPLQEQYRKGLLAAMREIEMRQSEFVTT